MTVADIQLPTGCMPAVGLGTADMHAKPGAIGRAVETALKAGYRHIDCASFYGNQEEIGEVLTRVCGSISRDNIFITSKLWNTDHRKVRAACEKTLKDLCLDYLDLYLIHWPLAFKSMDRPIELDAEASLAQTWLDMEKLVRDGLVKNIGVSNFEPEHLEAVMSVATITPAVNQVEMHPYLPQTELLKYCTQRGIAVTAYSPLGSFMKPSLLEDSVITDIAKRTQHSPAQVLLSWGVGRGTCVIPKSTTAERIEANLNVFELAEADMAKIDAISTRRRSISPKQMWNISLFADEM